MSRAGLAWFAQRIFVGSLPRDSANFGEMIDTTQTEVHEMLRASELLRDLDLDSDADVTRAVERLFAQKESAAWWAYLHLTFLGLVREAIADGNAERAAWAMAGAERFRAMHVFRQDIEDVVRMGHSVARILNDLREWEHQRTNSDETFWQNLFRERTYILSQVFAAPVVFIQDRAYVGGTRLDGTGGKYPDYLYSAHLARQAIIIEIKTPTTDLLGPAYRGGFAASAELSGTVIQAQNYRNEFAATHNELFSLGSGSAAKLQPRLAVIIGDADKQLDTPEKRKSFELFRTGLAAVEIVTYDELFKKIEVLAQMFGLVRKAS